MPKVHAPRKVTRKRELIEARNQADTLTYTTQKTLADLGDKVDEATKSDIESRIAALKTAMEGTDLEAIKQKSEELMKASHKLAEQMYAKTGAAGPGRRPGAGAGAGRAMATKRRPRSPKKRWWRPNSRK